MIIEVAQSSGPFHNDPDWRDWASFLQWLESIDADYFLQKLMSEHLLKKRFKAFLEAAIVYEKNIQQQLEILIPSKASVSDRSKLSKIQIPLRPKNCPNFNKVYGTWEGFGESLSKEFRDVPALHKKLRFSREFRKEVVNFLNDAFAFEDKLARQYQSK